MRIFIAFVSFVMILGCSNEYKKGEEAFRKRNFEEAKQHYRLIELKDEYYSDGQKRLVEISIAEKKQLFDNAVKLYETGRYNEAKLQFYLLSETDEKYLESRKFVMKVDSLNELKELAYQKRKKTWNLESKKSTREEVSGSNEVDEIKSLLNELIDFKSKSDFHKNGFSVTYTYHKWMDKVIRLKSNPEANRIERGFVMGDLETLGFEYLNSKGKETEYSRFMRKTITQGLNK